MPRPALPFAAPLFPAFAARAAALPLALLVAACAGTFGPDYTRSPVITPQRYACTGGEVATVLLHSPAEATLGFRGESYTMTRRPATDGLHFEGDNARWVNRGDTTAEIEIGESVRTACDALPAGASPASLMASAARLKGQNPASVPAPLIAPVPMARGAVLPAPDGGTIAVTPVQAASLPPSVPDPAARPAPPALPNSGQQAAFDDLIGTLAEPGAAAPSPAPTSAPAPAPAPLTPHPSSRAWVIE